MSTSATAFESLIKRDRLWVLTGVITTTALAWLYLLSTAAGMADMGMGDVMLSGQVSPWTSTEAGLILVMWVIMMVGMMLPSATPMILLFSMVNRKRRHLGETVTPTVVFVSGYFAAWTAFSVVATGLQWVLHDTGRLSPMMATTSALVGGVTLVAAGVYQWSPLKTSCLRHCQSPLHFLSTHWRNGVGGAFRMGWSHGFYCLGCCWILMGLLFVGGVMNLLWIAGLTIFVLVEKVWHTPRVSQLSGAALVIWGALVVTRSL